MTKKSQTRVDALVQTRSLSEAGRKTQEAGGAVLEYVLVSAFAAAVGMAALGFVGKMVRQQLQTMSERFGTAEESPELAMPWDQPS